MKKLRSLLRQQTQIITLSQEEKEAGRRQLLQAMRQSSNHSSGASEHPSVTFLRTARSVRLTDEEREEGKFFLQERMRQPVSRSSYAEVFVQRVRQTVSFWRWGVHVPAFAVVLCLLVSTAGGSVVYAAEGSLPGDSLYGVKVYFTEPLYGAVTMTATGKTRWAMARIERRLDEAEALITRSSALDEERFSQTVAAEVDLLERRLGQDATIELTDVRNRLEVALARRDALLTARQRPSADTTPEMQEQREESLERQEQKVQQLQRVIQEESAAVQQERKQSEDLERSVQERALERAAQSGDRYVDPAKVGSIRGLMLRKVRERQ